MEGGREGGGRPLRACQGCIGKGRRGPPPSRAPSLCSATVSLMPSAGFNGTCNRQ